MTTSAPPRVVLLVSFADVLGGAERSLLALATRLPRRGWTPVLACPPGALAESARRAGLSVTELTVRRSRHVSRRAGGRKTYSARAAAGYAAAVAGNAFEVARLARRVKPALVHSNSLSSHVAVALGSRAVALPVTWHLREIIEPGPGRRFFSLAGRLPSGMVAISDAVARSVGRRGAVDTVYNPVEAPPDDVVPASWGVRRPVACYLGRLDPRKGLEDLIVAAGAADADVVVVGRPWAGTPEYVASLHELAQQRAPGRIHFVGVVDGPWQALAAVDVLVVPSLAEPFGRVAAEGQRAGVTVLAADAGGLPEIVTDGVDGLLFPPADPAGLADRLTRVLADEALRARLGAAGRASSARFDPDTHTDAVARLFDRYARGASRHGADATQVPSGQVPSGQGPSGQVYEE